MPQIREKMTGSHCAPDGAMTLSNELWPFLW